MLLGLFCWHQNISSLKPWSNPRLNCLRVIDSFSLLVQFVENVNVTCTLYSVTPHRCWPGWRPRCCSPCWRGGGRPPPRPWCLERTRWETGSTPGQTHLWASIVPRVCRPLPWSPRPRETRAERDCLQQQHGQASQQRQCSVVSRSILFLHHLIVT